MPKSSKAEVRIPIDSEDTSNQVEGTEYIEKRQEGGRRRRGREEDHTVELDQEGLQARCSER